MSATGAGRNLAYGVDGTFVFFKNLQINTYWARTESDRPLRAGGNDTSYRAQLDYTGDRYGLQLERLGIGDCVQSGSRLRAARRHVPQLRAGALQPAARRPQRHPQVRLPGVAGLHRERRRAARDAHGQRRVRARLPATPIGIGVLYTNEFEYLPVPFRIGSGVTLPVGGYDFDTLRLNYNMGQQRAASANLSVDYGTFYNGHKTTLSVARGRVPVTHQLSFEPTYSYNRVRLSEGEFTTHLAGSRVTYTMTPLMFVSALAAVQLGHRRGLDQRAAALGIPARQRAVRRLQRGAQHADAALPGAQQPLADRQGQPAVPVLTGARHMR